MLLFWGLLIAAIGVCFFTCGRRQSHFMVYRLLAARSQLIWKKNVHKFYQVVGALLTIFGILLAAGYVSIK